MQRQPSSFGYCGTCGDGKFALDDTLRIPWHRRLKAGVDPFVEHVATDYEKCPGIGSDAVRVETERKAS